MITLPTTDNTDDAEAQGFHASIDSLLVRLATHWSPANITTVEPEPPRVDTAINPEEIISGSGSVFGRNDFQGGDGLMLAHSPNNTVADGTRYRTGALIDVWPEDPGDRSTLVTLARSNEILTSGLMGASSGTFTALRSTNVPIVAHQNQLFWVPPSPSGSIRRSTNVWFDALNYTGSTVEDQPFGPTGIVTGMVVHNGTVYAGSVQGGVKQYANGAWLPVEASARVIDGLWSVKGRLLYSDGQALRDVADPDTAIVTGAGNWVDVVDAEVFIVAANRDGYLYALTYDQSVNDWVLHGQSQVEGDHVPNAIAVLAGDVVVATERPTALLTQGDVMGTDGAIWTGRMDNAGGLVDKQLVRRWDDTAPTALVAWKNSVYVAHYPEVLRLDMVTGGLHPYLSLKDSLIPSSATDRRVAMVTVPTSSSVHGTRFDRLFYYAAGNPSGGVAKLWGALEQRESRAGRLTLPYANFFNSSDKTWVEVTAEGVWINEQTGEITTTSGGSWPNGPDGVIEVLVNASAGPETRGEPWLKAGELNTANGLSAVFPLSGELLTESGTSDTVAQSEYVGIKLVFRRKTGVAGTHGGNTYVPALLSVSVRGLAVPTEQDLQFPVNVSDWVERPWRKPFRVKGQGEALWQALKAREGRIVEASVFRPDLTIRGEVVSVATPIQGYTPRGSATTVAMVTIRGGQDDS